MKVYVLKNIETDTFIGIHRIETTMKNARLFRKHPEETQPIVCAKNIVNLEEYEVLTYNLVKE